MHSRYERKSRLAAVKERDEAVEKLRLVQKDFDVTWKEILELKCDADRRGGLKGELREGRDTHYEQAQAVRST
eukprot:6181562-Pleurochrysis_carterae.AAC.8